MNNKFSISEVISSAWEIVKKNLAPFIVAFLVYGAVVMVVYLLTMGGAILSAISMGALQNSDNPFAIYSLLFGPGFLVGMLLLSLLGYYFATGYCRMSLQATKGETPGIAAFKIPFSMFLNVFLAMLLLGIIWSIGLFLCILPGIYLMIRLMFTIYYIVDQGCGPIEGLSRSWERTKGNEVDLFLFILVLMLINVVGYLLCGVGLLITYPITFVAMALVYRKGITDSDSVVKNADKDQILPSSEN